FRCNPQIAGERQIHSLTAGNAVNGCDHGFGDGPQLHFQQVDAFDPIAHERIGVLVQDVLHDFDVAAGAKRPPFASYDDNTNLAIVGTAKNGAQHLIEHLEVDGIEIFRPVHGHSCDAAVYGKADGLCFHEAILCQEAPLSECGN